ncbi:kinesin-4-like isoform X1 [Canna indica]|uniref:Kinesin-4-like isoform X1 n=1 Tax=Canna indica TaxID=4628 RepID=A0AAQ3KKD1_9LILI|nr:kinesin-4-like isoform X1 [Canna indica]
MASDGVFSVSLASVVEDVLKKHAIKLSDVNLACRKAEEAAGRRYEAARWLRKVVGVVVAKDLPEEPSEEEFRLGLRNGLILCNALNKIHPGAVPKVVVNPGDPIQQPDGAALSAFQYFENVRNFLVAVQDIGLPTFEASDLEQGGKSARIVNSALALKSYGEWKQMGGHGSWRYGGNSKPCISSKSFLKKNSETSKGSLSRSQSMNENDGLSADRNSHGDNSVESEMTLRPLNMLVQAALSGKKPEELPILVESLLNKVMEEFEHRVEVQNESVKAAAKSHDASKSFVKVKASAGPPSAYCEMEKEMEGSTFIKSKKENHAKKISKEEISKEKLLKQQMIFEQQQRDIQELKCTLQTTKAGMEFMHIKYMEEFSKLGDYVHGLAHAASGYHKVLEDNRKLYNQVQDLKGSIRVYCRVRPFLPGQLSGSTIGSIDEGNITIVTPSKYGKETRRSFSFNKVFGPSASQEEVFSDTQPLIRSILDGYNVCIFAYGQTGSGKTYTMSGPKALNEQTLGVNYRALSDLFKLSEQRRGIFSYEIAVQMIEIYNEQVRDLLVGDGLNKRLEIRSNSQKGINVPSANLVPVASTSDVIELMNIGHKNRAVGATALNDRSSRSHSCLTVHVQGRDMTSGSILRGCLHLVDLAGSERVDKSEVTGERLKEAQHINKSLSALGDVISALAQKNSHVPYRNSKLTQLLQDSLGGQAKTLMFVHISPESDAIGETLSTLKFAERVSTVELGAARVNKESGEVKKLREQIASLKVAMSCKDEGSDHFQNIIPSPDSVNIGAPSPVPSNRQGGTDYLSGQSNHRQPMEQVGNIEIRSKLPLRQKKPSFDLQDLLVTNDSPPWPDSSSRMNLPVRDDKDFVSGDWVDKIMVNKQDIAIRDDSSMIDWEGDNGTPDLFYQRYLPDMVVYPDKQHHKNSMKRKDSYELEMHRSRSYYAATDDSDDLDIATSDSSEADMLWQFNIQNVRTTTNEGGSRIKNPQPKPTKSPDIRTPNHTHMPSASKKLSNGSRRGQTNSIGDDGKRIASGGKKGSAKLSASLMGSFPSASPAPANKYLILADSLFVMFIVPKKKKKWTKVRQNHREPLPRNEYHRRTADSLDSFIFFSSKHESCMLCNSGGEGRKKADEDIIQRCPLYISLSAGWQANGGGDTATGNEKAVTGLTWPRHRGESLLGTTRVVYHGVKPRALVRIHASSGFLNQFPTSAPAICQ